MTDTTTTMSRRMLVVAGLALAVGLMTQIFGLDLAYSQTLSVTVWSSEEDPGVDPDWAGWAAVPGAPVPLTAQQIATPLGGGSTPSMTVQTVHVDGDLVLRISWRDSTLDTSTASTELFTDGVAVQFPADPRSSVPAICMGQADGAVNIWHWRADSQVGVPSMPEIGDGYVDRYADISETYYPAAASGNPFANGEAVQSLLAGSFGTLTPMDEQTVIGEGRYIDNEWAVVLRRSFAAPTTEHPQFEVGQDIDVAFAIWNGSADERDGIKSVSQFVRFSISEAVVAAPSTPTTAASSSPPSSTIGYVVVGLFAGVVLALLLVALIWFGVVIKAFVDRD
jgi:hypothetical protein